MVMVAQSTVKHFSSIKVNNGRIDFRLSWLAARATIRLRLMGAAAREGNTRLFEAAPIGMALPDTATTGGFRPNVRQIAPRAMAARVPTRGLTVALRLQYAGGFAKHDK
jgi:hypothetical protein